MTHFSNPFQTQKWLVFLITQSEKHTSAKFVQFKSLYKVYILGSPAAIVWEVPWGHWVFEHESLFINIFTEEKCQKRQQETTICLRFHSNPSLSLFFPAQLTKVPVCPFVCVRLSNFCRSTSLCVHLFLVLWLESMLQKKKITWLIIPTGVTRRQIISSM